MTSTKTVTFTFEVNASDAEQELSRFGKKLADIANVSKLSDKALYELQKSAEALGNSNKNTEANVNAVTAALRKFQQNATIGSATYKQLGQAIDLVNQSATALKNNFASGGFSLGTLGADLAKVRADISALDLSTQAGRTAFAQKSAVAAQLEQRLNSLAGSYKRVSAAAIGASEATKRTFYAPGRDSLSAKLGGARPVAVDTTQYGAPIGPAPPRRPAGPRNEFRAGQIAGVLAGANIYAGPLGVAGGAVGAAFGGPGGALIGAQVAAQAAMLQQAIGGAATYSAELAKMRTALQGTVGAGTAYTQSLEAIAAVTRDLNVAQPEALKGFTQLSAAVIGAGGNVRDTEVFFRSLTMAVKAAGGSTEEISAALLAARQVFSKGKVSAEELNQIAERLPGAYTKFAQASGRVPAQLAKDLEQGKVGLNDFVKFLIKIGNDSEATALKISKSSEDAGARLNVELGNLQEEFGKVFQPLGAEAQEAFKNLAVEVTGLIRDSKPLVQVFAEILKGIRALAESFPALGRLGSEAFLSMLPAGREVAALANIIRNIQGKANDLQYGTGANPLNLNQGMDGANWPAGIPRPGTTPSPGGAGYTPTQFPGPLPKTPGGASKADAEARRQQSLAEQLAGQKRKQDELNAMNAIKLAELVYEKERDLARRLYDYKRGLQEKAADIQIAGLPAGQRGNAQGLADLAKELGRIQDGLKESAQTVQDAVKNVQFEKAREASTAKYAAMGSVVGFAGSGGRSPGTLMGVPGVVEYLTGDRSSSGYRADHGGNNYHEHIAFTSQEKRDIAMAALRAAGIQIGSINTGRHAPGSYHYSNRAFDVPAAQVPIGQEAALSQRVRAIVAASMGGGSLAPGVASGINRNIVDQGGVQQAEASAKFAQQEYEARKKNADLEAKQAISAFLVNQSQGLRDRADALGVENTALQLRNRLELEGVRPEVIDFELRQQELAKERADALAGLKVQLEALQAPEEARNQELAKQAALYDDIARKEREQFDLRERQRQARLSDPRLPLLNERTRLQDQAVELNNFGNQAVRISKTIGDSFGNAFSSVITGSASLNDALYQLFSDIARNFAEMAAEILANQLQMLLVNKVLGIFMPGGGAGAGAIGGGGLPGFNIAGSLLGSANGNAFASNGVVPFARGGVVNSPTMFRYGGSNLGIMGEAGPEAILPLSRRPDGKLGVLAERSALPRATAGGAYTNDPIRVETQVINGVEYATVEQVREATRQAERRGAEKGRASAYSGIQRSVGVRKRMGLG